MKDTFRTPRTNFGSSPMLFLAPWSISGFPSHFPLMMMRSLKPKNLLGLAHPRSVFCFSGIATLKSLCILFIRNVVFPSDSIHGNGGWMFLFREPIATMDTIKQDFPIPSQVFMGLTWTGWDLSLSPHRDRGIVDQFAPVDLMIISRAALCCCCCCVFKVVVAPGNPPEFCFGG